MSCNVNGGFFNQFDRFLATSKTSPFLLRLNGRHEGIIAANAHLLRGKRILDIASHDGRWSFSALKAGAAHVTGIEPRNELIDNAKETFAGYGVPASSYEFLCGDVFDVLAKRPFRFDLVLCLGFYYHTIRHVELFDRMERTGAQDIVIDTAIAPSPENMIQLSSEPFANESMAWEDLWTRSGHTIVGHPSRAAVQFIAAHFGFETREFNWPAFFARNPECATDMADYAQVLWRYNFPTRGEHPVVIISHDDFCAGAVVNVLYCTSQRQSRQPKPFEVLLNGADGMDWETFCDCSAMYLVPTATLFGRRGHVSLERRRTIRSKLRDTFRLANTD